MSQQVSTGSWREIWGSANGPILGLLCIAVWLHAASSFLAATTMPTASAEVGGLNLINWAFSLYQMGSIVAGAMSSVLVLRLGLKTALLAGALVYGGGSILAAIATSMEVLLLGRLLQGGGGGLLIALCYISYDRLFPNAWIPRIFGLTSAVYATSAFCGPLVGGWFSTFGIWRHAYWAFGWQAVGFAALVLLLFPGGRQKHAEDEHAPAFKHVIILAAAILAISVAGVVPGLLWASSWIVIGVLCLALFVYVDRRLRGAGILPRHIFDPSYLAGIGLVFVFSTAAATMTLLVYGNLLLEGLHGLTPLAAGYVVASESIAWGFTSLALSGVRPGTEKSLIRLGSVLITLSIVGMALFVVHNSVWPMLLLALIQGAGFGMMWPAVFRRVSGDSPDSERERTSAALPTVQQLGYALGAAATGVVAITMGLSDSVTDDQLRPIGFWAFAAFVPLSLVGNLAAWRLTR